MFEKVSKRHPDKVADRIAGALVDLAYSKQEDPKVAIEVLLGHNHCHIINETNCHLKKKEVKQIVFRIVGKRIKVDYLEVPQDPELAQNQAIDYRCGDNGIFKGFPVTEEQKRLIEITKVLEEAYPFDGKFILDEQSNKLIICQSNAKNKDLNILLKKYHYKKLFNPLGEWTGGINVDCGATNRKLGSDMADSITGGGLHGKDLSKADVSVNIYCYLLAQDWERPVTAFCAIGDNFVLVNGTPISFLSIVKTAADYVKNIGGFEKLAEYGLVI